MHYSLFYFDQLSDGKIQNLSILLSCSKLQYFFFGFICLLGGKMEIDLNMESKMHQILTPVGLQVISLQHFSKSGRTGHVDNPHTYSECEIPSI